jgi:hypothetical protein
VVTAHDRPQASVDEQHGLGSIARRLTLSDVAFHDVPTMSSAPIVAGITSPDLSSEESVDPRRDEAVLAFAFERATHMRVPLIVVSAWEMPNIYTWSPVDVARWRHRYASSLDERLAPWCRQYPGLEVIARSLPEPAHIAFLDASKEAQLTVLGRRSRAHLSAFSPREHREERPPRHRTTRGGPPRAISRRHGGRTLMDASDDQGSDRAPMF